MGQYGDSIGTALIEQSFSRMKIL